ncbi:hypothetical protein PAXINDRAFT_171790 [Paxillus involutus ATCC 200175]|uniref:Unplaced genomic scaffold PAXINscaffold_59, whole genome shotgun sequence n=1 Tax=Paxillus involutus ATCC 200175 TaxID=664439 RepID=A0A0C9TVI7_PAXIN|nr:hypothetical protein PAXINDRAFT_171790 [Paxillus involutus ATCC 200175]
MTMSTQRQDPLLTRAYTSLIHIGGLIRRSSTRACAPALRIGGLILCSTAFLVAGQLVFAFAAWAFVGFLVYHGQIPFRDSTVDRISRYHSETTLLVTLTATAISILCSFFFTKAVGRALTSRLCRPISLAELRTGMELSRRSFVLGWGWRSIATILLVVILNTLTAAWATILTPSFIVVNVDVTGMELDLTTLRTPATNGSLEPQLYPGLTDTSPLRWSFGPDVTPPIDVSPALSWGTSAGLGGLGVPSMQTVQLFGPPVFNISTGGMFPAAPTNITDIMSGAASPAHVASNTSYPHGLSTNYTILQQGFTVDVECRTQSFSDTGSGFPSMTLSNASLPLPPLSQSQPGSSSPLVSWAWTTNCTAYSSSYVGSILVSNAGEHPAKVLAGAVCPFQDFDGSSNQSALVLIQSVNGSYYAGTSEMSMACEVTPFITTIRVQYSGTTANISDVVDKTPLNADGSNWPLLFGPAKTLAMIFYSSQGMTDNYIVNSMIFTMAKLASNDATAESILSNLK